MAADTNDLKESPQTQHKTIHTLPPEILLHIFTLYEDRPYRGDTPPIWEIAKLTFVCSQWRTLILHTSAFWRHISAAPDLPWLTLCLKRSGDCTLDLEVITPFCADAGALALILPHARRIRSIFAHLSVYRDEYQMLRPLFDAGMPALETLELAPLGGFRYWRPVPPTIPWETVRWADDPATTACLPWLFVGRVAVPPSSGSSWRSLRVLKVSDIIQPREPCTCSLSHLMYVIAHNPSLQELSLLFYCHLQHAPPTPAQTKSTHVSLPKMSLRRLRTLALQGTLWFVSTMMQHLDVPADIPNVDVRIRRASTDNPTEEAFTRFLLSHCRPLLERMSDVVLAGDQEGQARLYSPKHPWPARRAVYEERLRLSLEDADAASNLEPRIRAFTRAMSSVPVRILTVKVSIRRLPGATPGATTAAAFWAGVFDAFASLERLHIIVQAVPHFDLHVDVVELLRALQPVPQPPRGADEQACFGAVRCPLLTRLSIHGEFGWLASGSCAVLYALAECVDTRARAGARIEDLDVHFWHRDSTQSLEEAHRAFLAQARSSVGRFACKVGFSAGCQSCIC